VRAQLGQHEQEHTGAIQPGLARITAVPRPTGCCFPATIRSIRNIMMAACRLQTVHLMDASLNETSPIGEL
jgi:hypothetical protein